MPSFTEHYVDRGAGRVYARDYAGAGPAFVMMHGFPDNLRIYDFLAPHLAAAGRRVVTFDFLGYGQSDKPSGAAYSFAQQLGDLEAVADALDLGTIVPVVHDSAGLTGVNFAIDHPERTASLVILNCAYSDAPPVQWPELIEVFANANLRALSDALLQNPEQFGWLVNFQRDQFRQKLADQYKARYDALLAPVIDGNFRSIPSSGPAFAQMTGQFFAELARNTARIPKLEALDLDAKIIWGEHDPYINVGVAKHFHAHMRRASLHLVPTGHWLQIDEPEMVATLMLQD